MRDLARLVAAVALTYNEINDTHHVDDLLRSEFTTSELERLSDHFARLGERCAVVAKNRRTAQRAGMAPLEPGTVA